MDTLNLTKVIQAYNVGQGDPIDVWMCFTIYMMIIQSCEKPLVYHKWFLRNAAKQLNHNDHTDGQWEIYIPLPHSWSGHNKMVEIKDIIFQ